MKKQVSSCSVVLVLTLCLASACPSVEAQSCKPSGRIRGRKPPSGRCDTENDSDCCREGRVYTTYRCWPPTSRRTKAILSLNSFDKGGNGGAPSECDNRFHLDDNPVVALSTAWFNRRSRCLKHISIYGNGRSVKAKVVEEWDSTEGCDSDNDYQPPCPNDLVDASKAVWRLSECRETTGANLRFPGLMHECQSAKSLDKDI